jgi:hypothetical protein
MAGWAWWKLGSINASDADVRQPFVTEAGLRFGEIAPGFRRMGTPLRSRPYWIGAKAFGVSASERDSPTVLVPGGSGPDGQPAFAGS